MLERKRLPRSVREEAGAGGGRAKTGGKAGESARAVGGIGDEAEDLAEEAGLIGFGGKAG